MQTMSEAAETSVVRCVREGRLPEDGTCGGR